MMDEQGITSSVQSAMDTIVRDTKKEYPGEWIRLGDPQNDARLSCRDFADSYHLSGACYRQLTTLLLENLPPQNQSPGTAPE